MIETEFGYPVIEFVVPPEELIFQDPDEEDLWVHTVEGSLTYDFDPSNIRFMDGRLPVSYCGFEYWVLQPPEQSPFSRRVYIMIRCDFHNRDDIRDYKYHLEFVQGLKNEISDKAQREYELKQIEGLKFGPIMSLEL